MPTIHIHFKYDNVQKYSVASTWATDFNTIYLHTADANGAEAAARVGIFPGESSAANSHPGVLTTVTMQSTLYSARIVYFVVLHVQRLEGVVDP